MEKKYQPLSFVMHHIFDLFLAPLVVRLDQCLDEVLILYVELQVLVELIWLWSWRWLGVVDAELSPLQSES